MKFYIVDAFADKLFGGNAAGVVIMQEGDPFPAEIIMQQTAAEVKFSETVFLQPQGSNTFKLRYFTPAAEVDLCGHATVGAFGALRDCGMVTNGGSYRIQTLAGNLDVEVESGSILMQMGAPVALAELHDAGQVRELAEVMGLRQEDIGMNPQIISTGLPDIMLHVQDKAALWRIAPDFAALAQLSKAYEVTGVHAFALPSSEDEGHPAKITAFCRNFAPLYEIDEEAATGTANGALTFYLYQQGLIKAGEKNTFIQGETMGRPSRINSCAEFPGKDQGDGNVKIKVGGDCQILVRGDILLG